MSYHVWQACKRRELYKENWIDWDELEKAKKIEGFGFLDEELKRVTLTIAAPGGVDYWPDHRPPAHPALCLLQHRDPAEMQLLPAPREGLDLLATPERDARPSWITMVPEPLSPPGKTRCARAGPAAPAVPSRNFRSGSSAPSGSARASCASPPRPIRRPPPSLNAGTSVET